MNESRVLIIGDEVFKYRKREGYNECCDASLELEACDFWFFNTEKQIQTCVLMYIETHVYTEQIHIHVCMYI